MEYSCFKRISLQDFFANLYTEEQSLFVDTNFFFRKYTLGEDYNKLKKILILLSFRLKGYKNSIIFDYLPIGVIGNSFLGYSLFHRACTCSMEILDIDSTKQQKVSVQIIVGRSQYLTDCLNSLRYQSNRDFETIFILNGKTLADNDAFRMIIEDIYIPYMKDVIIIENKEEVGEGINRASMIHSTQADYILPLDDDDYLSIDSIDSILKNIHEYYPLFIYAGLSGVSDISRFSQFMALSGTDNQILDYIANKRNHQFGIPTDLSGVDQLYVFHKNLWHYGPRIDYLSDYVQKTGFEAEIFLRAEESGSLLVIPRILYYKRQHTGQMTRKNDFYKDNYMYCFNLFNKVIDYRGLGDLRHFFDLRPTIITN